MNNAEEHMAVWKDFFCAALAGQMARADINLHNPDIIEAAALYADLACREYDKRLHDVTTKLLEQLEAEMEAHDEMVAQSTEREQEQAKKSGGTQQ
jgi:hypothetical protein